MKILKSLIFTSIGCILLTACQKEAVEQEDTSAFISQINLRANEQTPNVNFDESPQGLYHGVVASANTLERGKIWVNLANNSNFDAVMKFVDGTAIYFDLVNTFDATSNTYKFENTTGSFEMDVTDYNAPVVKNVELNNDDFFSAVMKHTTEMAPLVRTGYFSTPTVDHSGTWSIMSDGTVVSMSGSHFSAITSTLITYEGNQYLDSEFETFDAANCWGTSEMVPCFDNNHIIASNQSTNWAGASAWTLGTNYGNYINHSTCEKMDSGQFTYLSNGGLLISDGEVYID